MARKTEKGGKFPDPVINLSGFLNLINNNYSVVRISKLDIKQAKGIMKRVFWAFCTGSPGSGLLAYDSALYEQYQNLSLDTPDSGNIYTLLKEAYDIYCQVGGYPKVVETYLETRSFEKAQGVLIKIIDTFTNESIRYFTDILDTRVFTQIFLSICRILNRESRGLKEDSISEELQKLVTRRLSIPLRSEEHTSELQSL